jgi:hypothetical protein
MLPRKERKLLSPERALGRSSANEYRWNPAKRAVRGKRVQKNKKRKEGRKIQEESVVVS